MNKLPEDFSRHDPRWYLDTTGDAESHGTLQLSELRAMAWRQRRLVAAMVGAAALLGVFVTLLLTPLYTAEAIVRVDNEELQVVDGQDVTPVIAAYDMERFLNTQREILESRTMAAEVVEAGSLATNAALLATYEIDPAAPDGERAEAIASILQGGIDVEMEDYSQIVSIAFPSPDPQVSAAIANGYAENFVLRNVLGQSTAYDFARRILEEQVAEAQAGLNEAEQEAVAYARANRIIDVLPAVSANDDTGNMSLTATSLAQLNQAYSEARAARINAQERFRAAGSANPLELAEVRDNPALQSLLTSRAAAEADLQEAESRYLPQTAEVQQARARVTALDQQIGAAASRVRASLGQEYQIARRQEQQLRSASRQTADATLAEQDRRVQLNLLTRSIEGRRDDLQRLQTRLNEVNSASDVTANNVSIVDPALVPGGPSSPNLPRNLLFSIILGLAVGVGLGILREALDDTIYLPEDAERKLGLPLLGTTPLVARNKEGSGLADDRELDEAYFSTRFALDFATGGGRAKVMQITSTKPGEGKSTTAMALAADFARIGRRVLLVDADLRKPGVHKLAGIEAETGMADLLMRTATLQDAVVRVDDPGFDILPLGRVPNNPVQMLSGPIVSELFDDLRKAYDVVIVDSPPVMGLADAPLLAGQVDHTVLIVEGGRVHNGQARSAVRRLQDAGAQIAGIILTKHDRRQAGYGDDYGYYSDYAYGEGHSAKA